MKPAKKIITPRARKIRLKKFSKHWLEAVRLADVSVLADSGTSSSGSSGGSIGITIWRDPNASSGVASAAPSNAPVVAASILSADALSTALLKAASDTPSKASSGISTKAPTSAVKIAGTVAASLVALGASSKAALVGASLPPAICGVGAFVSPWHTKNRASNPPVFNHSTSYIGLASGGHTGRISIEHLGNGKHAGVSHGSWRIVATLDGQTLVSRPYEYHGSNHSYLEINVDQYGVWTFWGEFGSISHKAGTVAGSDSHAQFGCAAGVGDYLMYNSFTNCAVNFGGTNGWAAPKFAARVPSGSKQYAAVHATEDSILFQDNPPY